MSACICDSCGKRATATDKPDCTKIECGFCGFVDFIWKDNEYEDIETEWPDEEEWDARLIQESHDWIR